ncbi:hypothetical protein INT45_004077 [Circinella minor]|uniref:Homeobox domain-containing protein n=1 Tax=Circinella minor TaxID=1195481 RepID=A0A8H7VHW9_9FUNG|nr:hypothetical protein INT45_004077 [Circinella minor]
MSLSLNFKRSRSRQQKRRSSTPSSPSSSSSSNESQDIIPENPTSVDQQEEIIVEEHDYQRRKRYSREEQEILLQSFNINPRPSRREKQRLATLCHVDTHQIQVWFQNHRAKLQQQSRLKQKNKQREQQENVGSSRYIPYAIQDEEEDQEVSIEESSSGQQESLYHDIPRQHTPRRTTRSRILDHEPQQDIHDRRLCIFRRFFCCPNNNNNNNNNHHT